jgi:beta-phosphoglucomutase-like phosphatase (HAD superfamily)
MAADLLGVDHAASVAIEDSPTGATSAEAAGCRVLVVPNHVEVPLTAARVSVATLSDVNLDSLNSLVSAGF